LAKRRYNAKRLAKSSSLKKKIAKFVASYDISGRKYSLVEMLAYGHRGYVSYSEDELCKLFDKIYQHKLNQIEEMKKLIASGDFDTDWALKDKQRQLDAAIKDMSEANEIANEIFEEKVLG
jgi:hypothetical protein